MAIRGDLNLARCRRVRRGAQWAAVCLSTLWLLISGPAQAADPACSKGLWGCPASAVGPSGASAAGRSDEQDSAQARRARCERIVAEVRRSMTPLRIATSMNARDLLDATATQLAGAIALAPDSYEAHSLLGQLELERGRFLAAGVALRRAEELFWTSDGATALSAAVAADAPQLERADAGLALGLALLSALEGDLATALVRYQRLLRLGMHSPRLLYRTADVLMAQGRLDEAVVLFDKACAQARPLDVPPVDTTRACLGLLVALDRGERSQVAQVGRRLRLLDRGQRALDVRDYLSSWEREYHRALLLPVGCERRTALRMYLHGAAGHAPATYLARAEAHAAALSTLSCTDPVPSMQPGAGATPAGASLKGAAPR